MGTPSKGGRATLVGQAAIPKALEPRIRPWLGGGLWLISNLVVVVFGQLLLPQALVVQPSAGRPASQIAVACVAFTLLLAGHVLYWRRFQRHIKAESNLCAQLRSQAGHQLAARFPTATGPGSIDMAPMVFVSIGAAMTLLSGVLALTSITKLGSARHVDSPLLGLLYVGFTLVPFGIAMVVLGLSRWRVAGLRRRATSL